MVAARRADATIALQRVAAAQEQYFFTHNEYTDNAGNELGLGTGGVINSNEGYYSIAITPAGSNSTYTLTATPVAGSVQERDTDCASITLEHTGAKGSSPKGVDVCWRR
jgi:type IV pilus assembly protein PilE